MKELHGDTFGFKKKIIQDTVAYIDQYSKFPKELLLALAKCFMKFRIERLNRETRAATSKRCFEQICGEIKKINIKIIFIILVKITVGNLRPSGC
jgi:hypothetical protein